MDIKKPQLVKVEAFAYFFVGSSATPSLFGRISNKKYGNIIGPFSFVPRSS